MYSRGFTVTSIYLKLVKSIVCQVYQFLAEPFDTHERQLSARSESGDRAVGYSHTLRSRLAPVWKHRSRDDVHRQDLLRPEGHHAGGGLSGL